MLPPGDSVRHTGTSPIAPIASAQHRYDGTAPGDSLQPPVSGDSRVPPQPGDRYGTASSPPASGPGKPAVAYPVPSPACASTDPPDRLQTPLNPIPDIHLKSLGPAIPPRRSILSRLPGSSPYICSTHNLRLLPVALSITPSRTLRFFLCPDPGCFYAKPDKWRKD